MNTHVHIFTIHILYICTYTAGASGSMDPRACLHETINCNTLLTQAYAGNRFGGLCTPKPMQKLCGPCIGLSNKCIHTCEWQLLF